MSRRPVGEAAMSDAECQQRRRDKAKALRDAAQPPDVVAVQTNGSCPDVVSIPPAEKPGPADYPRMLRRFAPRVWRGSCRQRLGR